MYIYVSAVRVYFGAARRGTIARGRLEAKENRKRRRRRKQGDKEEVAGRLLWCRTVGNIRNGAIRGDRALARPEDHSLESRLFSLL